MNFRRWVVLTLGVQALVVLLDKCAGLVLLVLLRDRPDLKGAADLLATLPFIMMAVANLGLATALVYHMRRKHFPVREVAQTTSMVALVWGGIVALLAILVSQFVLPLIQPHWKFSLAYVIPICLCVPFLLTASYFNSIQLALERIKQYNLVHLTGSIAFLPLFFLFYWLCGSSVTEGIAFGRLATAALITIVTLIMLRGIVRWRPRMDWKFLKAGVTYGWKANLTSVLTYLNHRIDLYLVGILFLTGAAGVGIDPLELNKLQLQQVAFYSLAVTFAELVWHLPDAIRDIFFTKVAGSTPEQARKFTPILCRLCLAAALVGGVAVYLLVDPLMNLIIPDQWDALWNEKVSACILVLVPGTVGFTVAKILQADLAGRNYLNQCLVGCLIVLITMGVLDWLWVPVEGAVGAAWASSIAYITSAMYTLLAYRLAGGGTVLACLVPRPSDWEYVRAVLAALGARLRRKST
ncbi:MAG: MATE family efflux transporter [Planctomycetota bacterium]|jgi:O-antigen/teichoic acid export membrane protein